MLFFITNLKNNITQPTMKKMNSIPAERAHVLSDFGAQLVAAVYGLCFGRVVVTFIS